MELLLSGVAESRRCPVVGLQQLFNDHTQQPQPQITANLNNNHTNDHQPQSRVAPQLPLAPGSGWNEVKTKTGEVYYVNHKDKTTSWDRPAAVVSAQAAAPPPPASPVVAGEH